MAMIHNSNTHSVRLSGKMVWNLAAGETKHIGEAFTSLPTGVSVVKPKAAKKPKKDFLKKVVWE